MGHFVERLPCVAVIATMLLLTCCDKLTPAGQSPTMTLLHDGSEKVCIASDVQKALRELILPKPADIRPDMTLEARTGAVAGVSLSYDLTTLQSFDGNVSKASCNTTATIRSAGSDKTGTFRIDYAVSPSADSPGSFVVTASVDDARAFANDRITSVLDQAANEDEEADIARQQAQQKQALLAIVNEKWLLGTWIPSSSAATDCGNGQAIWFEPAHVMEGAAGKGRWSLVADQLHMVGDGDRHFDTTATITQADAISFQATKSDDSSFSLRRCSRDEADALPQPTTDGSAQR